MKSFLALLILGILLMVPSACGKAPEPVAEVSFHPGQIELPYPGYTSVQLRWNQTLDLGGRDGRPRVFVHLLDPAGSVVRTFDHPLPFDWQPGEIQDYDIALYQSALGPPIPVGRYDLSFGLYDRGGRRWPLAATGGEVAESEYKGGEVTVREAPAPMFYFSPAWLPLESGMDVQILGRRWLTQEGSIRLAEIPGPGSVWMRLRIPEPTPGVEELLLAEGESQPSVKIGGSCGLQEATLSGSGLHEVTIPLVAGAAGEPLAECEILMQPNYQLVAVAEEGRRALVLEILSWSTE
jgi:hypothetical protein